METEVSKTYTYQEVYARCLEYFSGDELAANVVATKYLLTNQDEEFLELSPDDMHRRIAGELARIEQKYPNPLTEGEIYSLLKDFSQVVPQGSPMSGIGNDQRIQSLSNCFVIESPEDSYGGILKTDQELVQIAKRRGGVGFDLSTIRPKGLTTANAARTTDGIEVFMDRFSNSCREVAQGGRRGALMLTISVHHPQIRDFIKIKQDLTRVTGANISVRVTDEFMEAVRNNEEVELRWPVDSSNPKISIVDDAAEIWHEIIEGAHAAAEPGVLFWDTAKSMTPSDVYTKEGFGSVSTNPCGEIILSPYDSCRLMLVNLTAFVKNPFSSRAEFDFDEYSSVVIKAQRLMDDMVDLEVEQVDKILDKIDRDPESDHVKYHERSLWNNIRTAALKGRRTGLGITGLGDALAMIGVTYGSEESVDVVEDIYKALALNAYRSSCILAKERGAFEVYDFERESNHKFIQRLYEADPELEKLSRAYGRRNIALTTTAPAGSVSVLTQTTSGIEPAFMLHYTRRKKLTGQDADARVDFVDDSGDRWQEYTVYHHGFRQWMDTIEIGEGETMSNEKLVEMSPYAGATANEIDWVAKVKMQAAAQKWVCHAISNTTNLPNDIDVETVKQVYMKGWELGCKGVTVYRDGSRSGVLVAAEESHDDPRESSEILVNTAPRRPEDLECDIHQANIKGEAWTILIGLLNGQPYEVIGGLSEYVEIPRRHTTGVIKKRVRKSVPSKYDLVVGSNGDEFIIKDVVKVFDNPNHSAFTRTLSLALRHGVPVQYLVEQLQKDKDADLFSFSKVIARCLKKYIADGTRASNGVLSSCCDSPNVVYQEGCATCINCGMAKCG
jgi:ribonucleoside-diphosphate reductase alpha chain